MYKKNLIKKIKLKKAKIGIIGLGYVGLPLACVFAKKKFDVTGFDIDKNKIAYLKKSRSYIKHIKNAELLKIKNYFKVQNSFLKIKDLDIIILCLPTPLSKSKKPDLSFIQSTLNSINYMFKKGQLVILESSTYPGSTKFLFSKILKKKKFIIGDEFFIGYSPEREDPSNRKYKINNIPKICSGITNNCFELTKTLYKKIVSKVVSVSNIETAEFTKIFENTYRSVNIALVNEMKVLSEKLNLNINEIINAAKTKPFGFHAFYPGPGVGGHCIPVDPYYLSWIGKKNNSPLKFVEIAGNINKNMPKWIIKNTIKYNNKIRKILLIGAAYKKNVDDTRESPIFDFIKDLKKRKIIFDYHDPFIDKIKTRNLNKVYYSKKISAKLIKSYDCVIIITDHDKINYNSIKKNAKLIIDTRNVYKKKTDNIIKL